jgi:hypothetical protein
LCDEVVAAFNAFTAKHAPYFDKFRDQTGFLHRVGNLHLVMPELMKVFSRTVDNLRFQDAAFGRPTTVYTSLYFERGSTQNIHRDTPYFCTRPEFQYFGTWFAFEDANLDNGCLEVIRGGHLIAEIDRTAFAVKLYGSPDNVPAISQNLWDEYPVIRLRALRPVWPIQGKHTDKKGIDADLASPVAAWWRTDSETWTYTALVSDAHRTYQHSCLPSECILQSNQGFAGDC